MNSHFNLDVPEENIQVGLFFYFNNDFAFIGCKLSEAENYGDFLIYDESHYDAWDRLKKQATVNGRYVDYDYYPRGRVVYKKSDRTFIIYYDRCITEEIKQLAEIYKDYKYKLELDEHYCCHTCNVNYCF